MKADNHTVNLHFVFLARLKFNMKINHFYKRSCELTVLKRNSRLRPSHLFISATKHLVETPTLDPSPCALKGWLMQTVTWSWQDGTIAFREVLIIFIRGHFWHSACDDVSAALHMSKRGRCLHIFCILSSEDHLGFVSEPRVAASF